MKPREMWAVFDAGALVAAFDEYMPAKRFAVAEGYAVISHVTATFGPTEPYPGVFGGVLADQNGEEVSRGG